MLDETRSDHDPSRRLEKASRAFLECRERGEEPDLRPWLLRASSARSRRSCNLQGSPRLAIIALLRSVSRSAGPGV